MSLPEISNLKIKDALDLIENLKLSGNKFEIAEKISKGNIIASFFLD